jgi:hypothetical protein
LGQAVHLYPLVYTGFYADFVGDQMTVHLPYWSNQAVITSFIEHSCSWLRCSNGITVTYIKVYGIDDDDVDNDIDNDVDSNISTSHQHLT